MRTRAQTERNRREEEQDDDAMDEDGDDLNSDGVVYNDDIIYSEPADSSSESEMDSVTTAEVNPLEMHQFFLRRNSKHPAAPLNHELAAQITRASCPSPSRAGPQALENWTSSELRMNPVRMMQYRENNLQNNGHFLAADCRHISSRYIPEHNPTTVDEENSRAYIGQFSTDGHLFVGGFQDRRIKLYDVHNGWKVRREILAKDLRWTITDTSLSPDQRFLVYASITPRVHIVSTVEEDGCSDSRNGGYHEGMDFSRNIDGEHDLENFGLWGLSFSPDGREIAAGSSDSRLFIYDVEMNRLLMAFKAHSDDINSVDFLDESSNIIISGSDDRFCKVWDRRVIGNGSRKSSGILVGHTEGVAHVSAKGDGRYFISNAKDQTIKLWDIRKMLDQKDVKNLPPVRLPYYQWDYRWMEYPGVGLNVCHPHDASLQTYRGHAVLQTLIRAYFSPMSSTGQKYIYCGSQDGAVYIYDVINANVVARMAHHRSTVRDCSWHPTEPLLASCSWDGTIAKWSHDSDQGSTAPPEALPVERDTNRSDQNASRRANSRTTEENRGNDNGGTGNIENASRNNNNSRSLSTILRLFGGGT